MNNSWHHNPLMPDGQTLVEWIRHTVEDECRYYKVPMPTPEQMAVVISAIRIHTIIMWAAEYNQSKLGQPDVKDDLWPMQSSIGRYFRDAAAVTLDKWRLEPKEGDDE